MKCIPIGYILVYITPIERHQWKHINGKENAVLKYQVVYASRTGNTQKVAAKIFETLPGTSKDIQKVEEAGKEADVYFVGFWNDKGTCSGSIMDYLSDLHGRKVALFGTCGMGGSREYFDQVAHRVEALIPDDNEYLGAFLCCGKMPGQVLERYKMMQEVEDSPRIRKMIQIYEEGMLHPDEADLDRAARFTRDVLEKLQEAQTDERE